MIFRAIFDQYDPGVANIFEPQKIMCKKQYFVDNSSIFERDSFNFLEQLYPIT